MRTYDEDRAEALAFLRHARPTNTSEDLAAAQVNATLALAAATHDVTLREYTAPIDLVPVEPQGGTGQPLADWERELFVAPADASGYSAPLPDGRHRVYVASSWRNVDQPVVVTVLRTQGHEVYDFRNPPSGTGFSWAEVKPTASPRIPGKGSDWEAVVDYLAMIDHPRARQGFESDRAAMAWADTFVLVLPSGKSAHLELGWAIGAGKRTAILLEDPVEPELMYLMADHRFTHVDDLLAWLVGS